MLKGHYIGFLLVSFVTGILISYLYFESVRVVNHNNQGRIIRHHIKFPYGEGLSIGNILEPEEVVIAWKIRRDIEDANLKLPYHYDIINSIAQECLLREYSNIIYERDFKDYYQVRTIRVGDDYFEILVMTKEYGKLNMYWMVTPDAIYNIAFVPYEENDGTDTSISNVESVYPLIIKK